jgi:hypothetical protein
MRSLTFPTVLCFAVLISGAAFAQAPQFPTYRSGATGNQWQPYQMPMPGPTQAPVPPQGAILNELSPPQPLIGVPVAPNGPN